MTLNRRIGINIYKYRIRKNLTQIKLAERADVSVKYLQNLESKNPKMPSIPMLNKIAQALDIEVWRLLKF